jgi:DNA-binding PadR family transcriptional regulator
MDTPKKEELTFLSLLFSYSSEHPSHYSKNDIIEKIYRGNMHPDRAKELFDRYNALGYLNQKDNPEEGDKKVYSISALGKNYLEALNDEKEKDNLDFKVKKLSVRNFKITGIVAWASLTISIATAAAQIYRVIDEKMHPKYSIQESQVKQLIQSQQDLSNNLQRLQKTIQFSDTSIKKIKVVKP